MDTHGLVTAILEGDCSESVRRARELSGSGVSPDQLVDTVVAAMTALDAKCTLEQFNLLEIMLAGRAATEVMKVVYPSGGAAVPRKGSVVLASLEGDVHDLGKNILRMVLVGNGYRVVDCGKDCALEKLSDAVAREKPVAVGVSGLISTIVPQVKQVRDLLQPEGGSPLLMAGGAALQQLSPETLNVDFVADSAFAGLHILEASTGTER